MTLTTGKGHGGLRSVDGTAHGEMGVDMVGQGYYAADEDVPAEFVLKRVEGKDGSYLVLKRFRYVHDTGEQWTIPAEDGQRFETDLASIPSLAGWLVPKDGRHTPAALVHDAMILGPGETHCYAGRFVHAEEADTLFRQGMQFLGVKFWRRWMIWAAVSILTLWLAAEETPLRRLANRVRLVLGLTALSIMGLFLLPDVLDFPSLASYAFIPDSIPGLRVVARWGPVKALWQIPEGQFHVELARFVGMVLAGTAVYALLWERRWRFGLFAGVTVPLVAWSTAVGAVSYAIYWVIELAISIVLLLWHRVGRGRGRVPAPLLAQRITGTVDQGPVTAAPQGVLEPSA